MNVTPLRLTITSGDEAVSNARAMRAYLRKREEWFENDLISEPIWNMLIDLFIAGQDGADVCVSSLCAASGAPQTTALRHIRRLTDQGLFIRGEDPDDRRRVHVRLSPALTHRMEQFFIGL